MYLPPDAAALLAAGALLLILLAWGLYLKERRDHRALVRARADVQPIVPAWQPDEAAPHLDHAWTDQPIEEIRGWYVFGCTVPGCTARDYRRGSRVWSK